MRGPCSSHLPRPQVSRQLQMTVASAPTPYFKEEVSSGLSVSLLSFPGPAAWSPWGESPIVMTTAPGGVAR